MQFSADRDTGTARLIPDASLESLIPIQIGTLHAQVCKFGHQWKCGLEARLSKFCSYGNYATTQVHWIPLMALEPDLARARVLQESQRKRARTRPSVVENVLLIVEKHVPYCGGCHTSATFTAGGCKQATT